MIKFERILVIEQELMHRPETSLDGGALRRLGRLQRMPMNLFQPVMPVHDAYLSFESFQQHRDSRCRLLAVRAFEVAVFHDDDPGIGRAELMIRSPGISSTGSVEITHGGFLLFY